MLSEQTISTEKPAWFKIDATSLNDKSDEPHLLQLSDISRAIVTSPYTNARSALLVLARPKESPIRHTVTCRQPFDYSNTHWNESRSSPGDACVTPQRKRVMGGRTSTDKVVVRMGRKSEGLRVVDLFCGAGGFSEGFRQMGFQVTYAVDIWKPAVVTHEKNHPQTTALEADVLELDPGDLGKVDVLIGSPPCTQFSFANKGGKGDRAEGMKLVLRYLEFVASIRPRYWIMENVPRLLETLPAEVDLREAGLSGGVVRIPRREILNSADYGVPQKRLRLFSGNYPLPRKTHADSSVSLDAWTDSRLQPWVPMRRVIEGLPDPLTGPVQGTVTDPNYPDISIPATKLTEHFYDSRMSIEEAESNRRAKTDHSWYGRMKFPDDLDRPARTIMATQLKSSRETIALVAASKGSVKRYRQPTVRECACLQSFPITYQFWGGNPTAQYMLVGNAVPPLMARALARAILEAEGIVPPKTPILVTDVVEVPPLVDYSQRTRKRLRALPLDRKFRDHIPGARMGGVRVDFDNMGGNPSVRPVVERFCGGIGSDERHIVQWVARLYSGSGGEVQSQVVTLEDALWEFAGVAELPGEAARCKRFLLEASSEWPEIMPDATSLQGAWSERTLSVKVGPKQVIEMVADMVDKHFPKDKYGDRRVRRSGRVAAAPSSGLPIRATAFLMGAALAAEIINSSDRWLKTNWKRQYRPDEWGEAGEKPTNGVTWKGDVEIPARFAKILEIRSRTKNLF